MKDCLGQQIVVGDIVAYTQGSYNRIYVVTQLGNNDNVKVNGSYIKASLTIRVTEQVKLHHGEKYVFDMINAVKDEFCFDKPKKAKTAPSDYYILQVSNGDAFVIKAQGFTAADRNKCLCDKLPNALAYDTKSWCYSRNYGGYLFDHRRCTVYNLKDIKAFGLEEYIDKAIPEDVLENLLYVFKSFSRVNSLY